MQLPYVQVGKEHFAPVLQNLRVRLAPPRSVCEGLWKGFLLERESTLRLFRGYMQNEGNVRSRTDESCNAQGLSHVTRARLTELQDEIQLCIAQVTVADHYFAP